VCGATWFGYTTFWVNRATAPIEELGVKPDAEGKTLQDLLSYVKKSIANSNSSSH
jgi:2-haloacid dehalogenase